MKNTRNIRVETLVTDFASTKFSLVILNKAKNYVMQVKPGNDCLMLKYIELT